MAIKNKSSQSSVNSHMTCAWGRGNTCKFWGCSHRELYSEEESTHDYEFYMANSACKHYKPKKR